MFTRLSIDTIFVYHADLKAVLLTQNVMDSDVCYSEAERKEKAKKRLEKRLEKRENT